MKRAIIWVSVVTFLFAAIAAVLFLVSRSNDRASLVSTMTLNELDQKSTSSMDTSRLATGIVPPTNKWFSGIALQLVPRTVFPAPLAFKPSDDGFSYGLTSVESTENTIIAGSRDDVSLIITDAKRYVITRYDELSVDLTYYDGAGETLAVVTIAAGVPYIFISDARDGLVLTSQNPFVHDGTYRHGDTTYATAGIAANGRTLTLNGSEAALYAAATRESLASLASFASNRVTGGTVSYTKRSDQHITTLSYATTDGETVMGYLPHHNHKGDSLYSYDTIYGPQKFVAGTSFSFSTKDMPMSDKLDLKDISSLQRDELVTILRREINATEFKAVDTYYAGKELYRSAQLLQLAHQLNQPHLANTIRRKMSGEFQLWFAPANGRKEKYFYYDTKTQTIVGEQASFGSQDSNDHHFHYGYFIYAASILAQHDPAFLEEHGDKIDLLVADIANYNDGEVLPMRRSFDSYFGHAWASGGSPFDDGNNQESSSEAINAWVATGLWAQVRSDDILLRQAGWMLSQEINAMQYYWLSSQTPTQESRYKHEIFSLNWSGKRDYATFFSDEPAAKLGILLIPLNPTMQSDSVLNRSHIAAQIKALGTDGNRDVYNFQDYLLMYRALSSPDTELLRKVADSKESGIDSANSRSYMYAWLVSLSSTSGDN